MKIVILQWDDLAYVFRSAPGRLILVDRSDTQPSLPVAKFVKDIQRWATNVGAECDVRKLAPDASIHETLEKLAAEYDAHLVGI